MSIIIRKQKEASIIRRHPWIFSGAIFEISKDYQDGEVVEVVNSKNEFLARGHYQKGTISVRVLTFELTEAIDNNFWINRIQNAYELRQKSGLFNATNSICRLVHGEGDLLPGLIIDWFNGVAIIQC